jgi:hypothetical protein
VQPSARKEAVADLTEGDGVEIAMVTSIEDAAPPSASGGYLVAGGSDDENDEDALLHIAALRARDGQAVGAAGAGGGARQSERDDDMASVSDVSEVGSPHDAEEVSDRSIITTNIYPH